MSPPLFSLGLAAALDSISAQLRGLDASSKVFAYLDDLVVVVAPGQAETAHKVVGDTLSSHGLALNAGKTCVWSRDPGAPLPAALPGTTHGGPPFLSRSQVDLSLRPAHHGASDAVDARAYPYDGGNPNIV